MSSQASTTTQPAGDPAALARWVRATSLRMIAYSSNGHPAAELSAADILSVLYASVLCLDPSDPYWPERDRFICSKSHASAGLYSALCSRGFLSEEELLTYGQPGSRLCTAVSSRLPGVEFATGALGHGLPFAAGAAIAAKLDHSARRVIVLCGDGELQEGSNWEAAMLAASRHLDNLTLVIDRNRVQKGASTEEINALEPLAAKWRAFGWGVRELDGHDHAALRDAFQQTPLKSGRPTCLIANTVKGKGVDFMENHLEWHGKQLSADDLTRALAQIEEPQ
jgi:transketolase